MHTSPQWAKQVLRFRCGMLDAARKRAREAGHGGALYPWRTISGEEASAWYAAGTAQYHINADIAYAMHQYGCVTGDLGLPARRRRQVLVETARLWMELGFFSERARRALRINSVTGPDEYTTVVDNNAYTNLMAKENLEGAIRVIEWLAARSPRRTRRSRAPPAYRGRGRRLAPRRASSCTSRATRSSASFCRTSASSSASRGTSTPRRSRSYPLLLHHHPLELYRHQVIKQTDVVLATYLVGHHFSEDEKRRTFDYYDPLTTGDSTLSACIQSVVASEVGYPEAALEYFVHACTVDLRRRPRQHRRRHPHRLLRRDLAGARGWLRRPARRRRRRPLSPAPAR